MNRIEQKGFSCTGIQAPNFFEYHYTTYPLFISYPFTNHFQTFYSSLIPAIHAAIAWQEQAAKDGVKLQRRKFGDHHQPAIEFRNFWDLDKKQTLTLTHVKLVRKSFER